MSLLDKATIITTPTAHSNGVLHSIKGGSVADFDVVRSSSATRVNAEGLIEDISTLSGELVTNGGFDSDTNWALGTGWSINGGSANCDSSSGSLYQSSVVEIGKSYICKFEITSITSGSVAINAGGNTTGVSRTSVGTYSEILQVTSGSNNRVYIISQGFQGSVDNISVKEVIDATNIPRIDYTDGTASLLLEPQSTNLVTDSQNYNSTCWGGQRGDLSDGGGGLFYLSPNSNVIKYEVNQTGFNQMYYRLPSSVTIGNTYTKQGYVKCDDAPYIHFQVQTLSGNPTIVWDNVNNVVISSGASIDSYNITSLNGWVKAEITYTATVATIYASLKTYFSTSSTDNSAGVPIGTIAYQTFVQLEEQSYATSYIPTSGAIATRLADVVTGAGDATTFNSTEGVLYAEMASLSNVVPSNYISISDGTYNNRLSILYTSGSNIIRAFLRVGGASQVDMTFSVADIKDFHKVAFKYKENDFALWIDGVEVGADTSGSTMPSGTLSKLSFSEINTAAGLFRGKVKSVITYNTALTDAELECLTTI